MSFPQIDPVLLSIGPLQIRWYGLMYVLGFIATYFLVERQIKAQNYQKLAEAFENLNITLIICVILGGRLGYVLFYNFSYYANHPLEILATWHGGMSFHGACILVILGGYTFCKLKKLNFWRCVDIYVVTVPIGLGLGRLGNFINGELYGRHTDVPWGMVFPAGGPMLRHPSQLYEFFLEGIVLFIILWRCRKIGEKGYTYWPKGTLLALFLICYGFFRIIVEFFREPDAQLGFLFANVTMGQTLSLTMIGTGIFLWIARIRLSKNS